MLHANATGTENAMPNLPDEKNPEMCLQALDTGAWVGFAKAAQELADEEGAQ